MFEYLNALLVCGASFAGGALIGLAASRIKKRKSTSPLPEVIEAPQNPHQLVQNQVPQARFAKLAPENLDQALSAAVYRAIESAQGDLDLEISFPEKAVLFGREVSSKGKVRLGASSEVRAEISRILQKLEEIDTKVREFSAKNASAGPPENAFENGSESEEGEVPLF